MAVHRLAEQEIVPAERPRLKLIPPIDDSPVHPPKPVRPPMKELSAEDVEAREAKEQRNVAILVAATANLSTLARIVSARLILLLAVVGAFALALFVIDKASIPALITMGLYVVVVTALVALESGLLSRIKS